jgi:hypothetical protein
MSDDLETSFARLREADARAAPAWRPLRPGPLTAATPARRFRPAVPLAVAAAVGAAVWLLAPARPRVADLPSLIDHEPRDLFATLDLPSTDGLLPSHLTVVMP